VKKKPNKQQFSAWVAGLKDALKLARILLKNFTGTGVSVSVFRKLSNQGKPIEDDTIRALHRLARQHVPDYAPSVSESDLVEWAGGPHKRGPKQGQKTSYPVAFTRINQDQQPVPSRPATLSAEALHDVAVHAIRKTVEKAMDDLQSENPSVFDSTIRRGRETNFEKLHLESYFGTEVRSFANSTYGSSTEFCIFGDESPSELDRRLRDHPNATFARVDALDGRDLFQRKIGNWCCASSFFVKHSALGERIKAVAVGVPNGGGVKIFSAVQGEAGIRVTAARSKTDRPIVFKGQHSSPWGRDTIQDSVICCVGQKRDSFLSLCDSNLVSEVGKWSESEGNRFRIYNLGGMPMIMRLLEGRREHAKGYEASGVDAVFGVYGSKSYDVVPGVYLAQRFGATVLNHDKSRVRIDQLEEMLLNPTEKGIQYVIAGKQTLAENICVALHAREDKPRTPSTTRTELS
jgi:hypothetical protein